MVRFFVRRKWELVQALSLIAVLLGSATRARAQVLVPMSDGASCNDPRVFPNAVNIAGSSAFLAALSGPLGLGQIFAQENVPISVLYQPVDSCLALNDLLGHRSSGELPGAIPQLSLIQRPIFYGGVFETIPGTNAVMTANGDTCTLPDSPPPIDIAVTDVYFDTCSATTDITALPDDITETLGPIETATFAAPVLSTATAISAEAAYVVFGYDAVGYAVPPWTDPGSIFVREATSGVQTLLGAAIGLGSPYWANSALATSGAAPCLPSEAMNDGCVPVQQRPGSAFMGSALANVTENQSAYIGVLSETELSQYNAGASVNKLKSLAYQHTGQPCGYLPNSTASAKDKLNVRQGRYAAWGPLHIWYNIDAKGNPLPGDRDATKTGKIAAITSILNYFITTGPHPNLLLPVQGELDGLPIADAVDSGVGPGSNPPAIGAVEKEAIVTSEISGALVPWCAMQVVRTSEMGPEASYEPPEPCTCFYSVATGATSPDYCATCSSDLDCAAPQPICRLGYCEIQ